jgi:K+-transporting ATPase KdpF subunit
MESTFELVLTLIVALALFVYVVYTLIKPEKF